MAKAKTVVKKKPVKATTKRKATKKDVKSDFKTLRVGKVEPFFTLRLTKQTAYWTILILFIIFIQLWILKTQLDVSAVIESIPNPVQQ